MAKMIRTVSLLLYLPEDRFLPMMETCACIFNEHTRWASENRTWNKRKAHEALYCGIREAHPEVNSAILQATRDCALEAVKRCNKGRGGIWKVPVKRTLSVRYNLRTLSVRGNLLTLSCIGGHGNSLQPVGCKGVPRSGKRFRTILYIPTHFRSVTESLRWRCKGATLKYIGGRFRLNLFYEADMPPKVAGRAVGIDLGIRNFAVTSDGDRHPLQNPGVLRAAKRRYFHNKRMLQAKGTRSAKRHLHATAGREERFSRNMCHVVSKAIAGTPGVSVFVLEDLRGIRGRRRGRWSNRDIHGWPHSRLRSDLTYKAEALGKTVVLVPPAYTSQRCSKCGHTESGNRRGSRFRCRMCGLCGHADTNAAENILFVYESGAVLCASSRLGSLSDPAGPKVIPVARRPSPRRKAPGGQVAVNQPKPQGYHAKSQRRCTGKSLRGEPKLQATGLVPVVADIVHMERNRRRTT